MKAEIVSIGTELLLGTITDTNAAYLAQKLAALGIDCYYISQVGDNLQRLIETLARAWDRSDLTVTTGGLGPTQDDLTREAIASLLGETPTVDPRLEARLRAFFQRRNSPMPDRNLKQATVIPSARSIANPVGTAPGWWISRPREDGSGSRQIVAMPGVPFEMKIMWEREVEPLLAALSSAVIVSRTLKTVGLGESMIAEMVSDLMSGSNPTLAPYAKPDGVHLRITAKASSEGAAREMIAGLETAVRARLGDAIYGADNETPWEATRSLLSRLGLPYALLEVGEAAQGAIAGLAVDEPLAKGVVSLPNRQALEELPDCTRHGPGSDALADGLRAIARRSGAGLALGLEVAVITASDVQDPVQAEARIGLLILRAGAKEMLETRQSWRTARSEVGRLAGLAAINFLRRHLLAMDGR